MWHTNKHTLLLLYIDHTLLIILKGRCLNCFYQPKDNLYCNLQYFGKVGPCIYDQLYLIDNNDIFTWNPLSIYKTHSELISTPALARVGRWWSVAWLLNQTGPVLLQMGRLVLFYSLSVKVSHLPWPFIFSCLNIRYP